MPNHLFSLIYYFLKQHKLYLLAILVIVIIASLEISFSPYVLKIIIDRINQTPENSTQILNALFWPALIYVLLTIIHNLAMRSYDFVSLKLFPQLRTEISVAMFNHLSKHSLSFFQQNFSGDLASKLTSLGEGIETILKIFNQAILGNIVTLIIASILLTTVHVFFSLVLLCWVILYVGNGFLMAKKTAHLARDFSATNTQFAGQLVDSISNIVSAKIFANISYESTRIDSAVRTLGKKEAALQGQIMQTHFYQNMIYTLLIAFLLFGLIFGRMRGWVTVGDFAFILSLSIAIASMINGLTQALPVLSREIGKCQQAIDSIIVPHDIKDAPNAKPLVVTEGAISFQQVSFGYHKKALFNDLSVKIKPKQKIGLVGFSGGGKTTFINLILRLYDIQSGEISIDNQNINSITMESLIKNIALIPQHPELFHRSIMDNIRYGDIEASEEDVIAAAKLANCHDFIMQLENGYQSLVGEKGIKLSGGQRQRIAIARAVLKDAPILILDEATSALDSVTEKQIQLFLQQIMANKTVLVIAHRLTTILAMERILFFKEGNIIEDGSIEDLRSKPNGYFANFLRMQESKIT